MADEELNIENLSPSTLIAWERIQLPSPSKHFLSQSPVLVLSDPHGGGVRRSMPSVPEDHQPSIVFPPNNHEDLTLLHHNDIREACNERPRPSSPVSIEHKPSGMGASVAGKWWFLHFKLPDVVSCIWKISVIRGGLLLRSFSFPLALLLLFYLRFRLRRRRQLQRETIDQLLSVIKEKDERIDRLQYQIARMNELLLATHHGVPLISKKVASG